MMMMIMSLLNFIILILFVIVNDFALRDKYVLALPAMTGSRMQRGWTSFSTGSRKDSWTSCWTGSRKDSRKDSRTSSRTSSWTNSGQVSWTNSGQDDWTYSSAPSFLSAAKGAANKDVRVEKEQHQGQQEEEQQEQISIGQYSRSMYIPKDGNYERRNDRNAVRDEKHRYAIVDARPRWEGAVRFVAKLVMRGVRAGVSVGSTVGAVVGSKVVGNVGGTRVGREVGKEVGSLILLRCGQSSWSRSGRFTGWADPELTSDGVHEMEHAGRLLLSQGHQPDILYTSRLRRAVKSSWILLNQLQCTYLPVYKSWRLNERCYGALTGLRKVETAKFLGGDVVQSWRNTLKARPPPMTRTDPYYPGHDRRYDDLTEDQLPLTESLLDCMNRARPLWEYGISKELRKGNNVLVLAHTNTLRSLMQVIDDIGENEIQQVSMPSGIPFIYKFDSNMKPIPPSKTKLSQLHTSGTFLETPGLLQEAIQRNQQRIESIPGSYGQTVLPIIKHRKTNLEESLLQLKREQTMAAMALSSSSSSSSSFMHKKMNIVNPNDDGQLTLTTTTTTTINNNNNNNNKNDNNNKNYYAMNHQPYHNRDPATNIEEYIDDSEFEDFSDPEGIDFFRRPPPRPPPRPPQDENRNHEGDKDEQPQQHNQHNNHQQQQQHNQHNQQQQQNQQDQQQQSNTSKTKSSDEPIVIFLRHGRTPHNNLGLFTGWEDPPLAPEGIEDAKQAGRLLKLHGFELDVVYTSWLTRAIQTAYYCISELDEPWLPMIKSWRLNERMYGALTGKSKQMIANEYGEDQLKRWRRGFKIRPPPVSSYSLNYPGNDYRRTKYVRDLRISFTETINRSVEARSFQIHRKFPKTESLWDCMQRSIPFYTQRIVPEAVDRGKTVLIASHENAIRGILMHLCNIPEEAMNQLHLPNGLPLVYNVKRKCITLLDDGSGMDPMKIHDFGPAAQYLFRPCELDNDFFDQMGS